MKFCTVQAVVYFQRAIKLDSNYLSAWTLMGHEYVEMKNPNAAIEAYRRAVDLDSRDFRAWYGLGQTYEMLSMPYYAIYYFRRAAQLRPYDARMWVCPNSCCAHTLHTMKIFFQNLKKIFLGYFDPHLSKVSVSNSRADLPMHWPRKHHCLYMLALMEHFPL